MIVTSTSLGSLLLCCLIARWVQYHAQMQPSRVTAVPPESAHYCFNQDDILPTSRLAVAGISKIYIVHWTKLTARRKLMQQRLNKLLPFSWQQTNFATFVERHDAEHLDNATLHCLAHENASKLKTGLLSLTSKHFVAYHDMVVHGYPTALILEDDADFSPNALQQIEIVLNTLPARWSTCMVSGCFDLTIFGGIGTCGSLTCEQPPGLASNCACGYLLSQHGARQMLAALPIRSEPDLQMNYASRILPFRGFWSLNTTNIIVANATDSATWRKVG